MLFNSTVVFFNIATLMLCLKCRRSFSARRTDVAVLNTSLN